MDEDKDKIYHISDKDRPLNEDDVRIIVAQQLRNITAPTVVQAGYLQSGNFVSGSAGWQLTPTGAEFQTLTISGVQLTTRGSFGGDGSDGALAITSGTTTVDLGGASLAVLQYSSVSITGTGKLAFSNPASTGTTILMKVKGGVTISSTQPGIDVSNCGAAGGASVTDSTTGGGGTEVDGLDGTDGATFDLWVSHKGIGPTGPGTGGAGGAVLSMITAYPNLSFISPFYKHLFVGAGGGSGMAQLFSGAGSNVSGVGGRGGGCLIIECGGAWNFTGSISVGGSVGGNGTAAGDSGVAGGGGGGGGGCFIVLYNTLTANTGTVSSGGGLGGDGDSIAGLIGSGGGGGGSRTAGSDGTGLSTDPDGGAGGAGYSLIALNTFLS